MRKITALIPTYQRPTLLRRAILSVLKQTYTNVQVSVFDNASEDTTEQMVNLLKKTDNRIHYYRHPTNIGALNNFKFAFQSIDTPYFSILSDDDALAFDFYEKALTILEQHPDIMFVILNTLTIDEKADLIANKESTGTMRFYRGNDRLNTQNIPSTWTSILFKKEVAKLYLEMDSRFDIASDMKFLELAKARYDFSYLSRVGAFFTQQKNSISYTRKRFDIIHHAVQISRHIEIYYHPEIKQAFKDSSMLLIKKMLKWNKRESWRTFVETLKIAIKQVCDSSDIDNHLLALEIQDAKNSDFHMSAFFLKLIYQNNIIKSVIRMLFSNYYQKLKQRRQAEMSRLQSTTYNKIFSELKSISS